MALSSTRKPNHELFCIAALMIGLMQFSLPCLAAADTSTQDSPPSILEGRQLLSALRAGGHVIYFRHGITDHFIPDRDREKMDNCETQRPLSDDGRKQMRGIGAAIKALGIRVSSVLSSPFCRCIDSATLAFGKAEISNDLQQGLGADKADLELRAQALRTMLAAVPSEPGTNTVLVGHSTNLQVAVGIWLRREGTAAVFRPGSDGKYTYIATVLPEYWQELARSEQHIFGW